jgi:hypothetical protein
MKASAAKLGWAIPAEEVNALLTSLKALHQQLSPELRRVLREVLQECANHNPGPDCENPA